MGAAIGSRMPNPYLALFFAFLSHYILDTLPHIEYSIDNIRGKNWKIAWGDIKKVAIDISLALLIILVFSPVSWSRQILVFACAFIAIIPDGFTVMSSMFPNKIMSWHDWIHTKKIHYLTKEKKFSTFWRITSQIFVIILSLLMMKF